MLYTAKVCNSLASPEAGTEQSDWMCWWMCVCCLVDRCCPFKHTPWWNIHPLEIWQESGCCYITQKEKLWSVVALLRVQEITVDVLKLVDNSFICYTNSTYIFSLLLRPILYNIQGLSSAEDSFYWIFYSVNITTARNVLSAIITISCPYPDKAQCFSQWAGSSP